MHIRLASSVRTHRYLRNSPKMIVACLAFAVAILARSNGQGNGNENPLLGTWHQVTPAQVGGVIHNFMSFGADGSFFSSSLNEGGQANGARTEVWGRYTIRPAQNGYLVTMYYAGKAPLTLCMPGLGCRPNGNPTLHPDQGIFQFQGNMLRSTNGFIAQRSPFPPVLMQRLPATWVLQPPPPLNVPSSSVAGGGGRYVTPKTPTPGIMGNCDDQQQANICHYGNGGWYHKDQATGCMICDQNSGVHQ